jgi:hypothetical protein
MLATVTSESGPQIMQPVRIGGAPIAFQRARSCDTGSGVTLAGASARLPEMRSVSVVMRVSASCRMVIFVGNRVGAYVGSGSATRFLLFFKTYSCDYPAFTVCFLEYGLPA